MRDRQARGATSPAASRTGQSPQHRRPASELPAPYRSVRERLPQAPPDKRRFRARRAIREDRSSQFLAKALPVRRNGFFVCCSGIVIATQRAGFIAKLVAVRQESPPGNTKRMEPVRGREPTRLRLGCCPAVRFHDSFPRESAKAKLFLHFELLPETPAAEINTASYPSAPRLDFELWLPAAPVRARGFQLTCII